MKEERILGIHVHKHTKIRCTNPEPWTCGKCLVDDKKVTCSDEHSPCKWKMAEFRESMDRSEWIVMYVCIVILIYVIFGLILKNLIGE